MTNNRILILQRLLPHYRTGVFKYFGKVFPNLRVAFGDPCKDEPLKNDASVLPDMFVKLKNSYPLRTSSVFNSDISSLLNEFRPEVVITVFNVGNLNIYKLLRLRRRHGFKLILWSFGYDPSRGFQPGNNFADKLRLYLSKKADAVIFYWKKGREEVEKVTGHCDKFFVAPNTLDTTALVTLKKKFDEQGRESVRKELGITEEVHFVYVGRLLADKQVDLLLNAFGLVARDISSCRLTIIGDGPETEALKSKASDFGGSVVFTGEILDDELTGKWIYSSEAFVMPGRLGLSVVHSFCFGTPVISQRKDSFFHGEGIGYVKDGVNGLLCKDGDIDDLAAKMKLVADDKTLSALLRKNAFDTVASECSVEMMVAGFEEAVKYVTAQSK